MRPARSLLSAGPAIAVLVSVLLAGGPAVAQSTTPVEAWRRSVTGHVGVMMDLDAQDNVFALGYASTVVTRKYSPNGAPQWSRALPDRALPAWISTDPSSNAVVAAYRITGVNTPAGWRVIKYDPNGNVLWEDTILASSGRTVRVETDGMGNAYVVGSMALDNSVGNLTIDTVTIKYAPNGTKLWTRVFNGGDYTADRPASLAISNDGSRVAVVGQSSGWLFTVMYDAQGNQVGQLLREDLLAANDAAFGPQNELHVGATSWTPATSDQMTILKLSATGNLLFVRPYPDGDFVYRMAVDAQGNVVAAGVDDVYMNWVTLKTEPDGDLLWSEVYDATHSNDERPFFLSLDPRGNIYVTGEAGPPPPGPNISYLQVTTVKDSPDGTQEWVLFSDTGRGVAVRIGTDLAVYVQGQGEMLTVRYDQAGGASQEPPLAPSGAGGHREDRDPGHPPVAEQLRRAGRREDRTLPGSGMHELRPGRPGRRHLHELCGWGAHPQHHLPVSGPSVQRERELPLLERGPDQDEALDRRTVRRGGRRRVDWYPLLRGRFPGR